MIKAKTRIFALAAVMLLIFSAAAGTLRTRAAEIRYIDTLTASDAGSDSSVSTISAMGAATNRTGLSGAMYDNGLEIHLKRASSDEMGFVWADYQTDKKYSKFAAYVDILTESTNSTDYSVVLQLVENGTKKTTMTLDPRREYPVKIEANIADADTVRIYIADTEKATGELYIALGNAAFLESTDDSIPRPKSASATSSSTSSTTTTESTTATTSSSVSGSTESTESQPTDGTTATTAAEDTAALLKAQAVSFKTHQYLYVEQNLSWDEAKTWCEVNGGYLASVTSQEENDFISNYLKQKNKEAYIGLVYRNTDFEWASGEAMSYSNWAERQPVVTGTHTGYGRFEPGADKWSSGYADSRPLGFIIEWGDKQTSPAENPESSEHKNAVIVLPGMGGSVLTDTAGKVVWKGEGEPPAIKSSVNLVTTSGTDLSTNKNDIIACTDSSKNTMYDAVLSTAAKVCSDSDIELFQWDWRNSALTASQSLAAFIEDHGWEKVTLIGHDAGGLVACRYLASDRAKVDKVITLGTPFYGSVRAVYESSTGVFCDGLTSDESRKYEVVGTFPMLNGMMPCNKAEKYLGTIGMTGTLTSLYDNSDAVSRLSGTSGECIALYELYDSLKDEEKNPLYVIASSGVPTLSGLSLSQDGTGIDSVFASLDGDGSTLISSSAPDFGTERKPYILNGVDNAGLISDETSLTMVANILRGLGDGSSFNAGCGDKISRTAPKNTDTLYRITAAGPCSLSLSSGSASMTLNNGTWKIGGNGKSGYICPNNVKTIFTTDPTALISSEVQEGYVQFEISSSKGAYSCWHSVPTTNGMLLTALPVSRTITVANDPGGSGIREIDADVWTGAKEVVEEPEEKGYKPTWFDLGAVLCFITAAALCFIGIPACAFGLTKIELKQKREMKKRMRQLKRLQKTPALAMPLMMPAPVPPVMPPVSNTMPGADMLTPDMSSFTTPQAPVPDAYQQAYSPMPGYDAAPDAYTSQPTYDAGQEGIPAQDTLPIADIPYPYNN